jgi:NDP-sugar pyrophosphorylase family protein
MWSRYGGLKQIDGFWPHWQAILEYSIYDAIRAWFGKVVIVLRNDFQEQFDAKFANTFQGKIEVQYVYQTFDLTRYGFGDGSHREKPWGTAHAILTAQDMIDWPFAVINADDYYGVDWYQQMSDFLSTEASPSLSCMIGYQLDHTLSATWWVNRWVCTINNHNLQSVSEHHKIARDEQGIINCQEWEQLADTTVVSMNFWWFDSSFMQTIEAYFNNRLSQNYDSPTAESYIPSVVDDTIHKYNHAVRVLVSHDEWYWVTNPDDKPEVVAALVKLTTAGVYPENLW